MIIIMRQIFFFFLNCLNLKTFTATGTDALKTNQNKTKKEQPFHYIKVMLDSVASFKWF